MGRRGKAKRIWNRKGGMRKDGRGGKRRICEEERK